MYIAVVVAHPDDETLWAGGLIADMVSRGHNVTVICATIPRADPIRAVKFTEACAVLGADSFVMTNQETDPNDDLPEIMMNLYSYNHIITHGADGEYGHRHHKNIHDMIRIQYAHKPCTYFGYKQGKHCFHLSPENSEKKMAALKKYDHILPYGGKMIPKWEALYERYIVEKGVPFYVEYFDGHAPP